MNTSTFYRRCFRVGLLGAAVCFTVPAFAQLTSRDMPGTDGAVAGSQVEEPLIEISVTSEQMPVLIVAPATTADAPLAEQIAAEIQLTGLFNVRTTVSMRLGAGLPERSKWPALSTAAVVVGRLQRPSGFPIVISDTYHAAESDVYRRRELVLYPGSEPMMVSTMADAILEDVLGIRSHMSGKLVLSDASTSAVSARWPGVRTSTATCGLGMRRKTLPENCSFFKKGKRLLLLLEFPATCKASAFLPTDSSLPYPWGRATACGPGKVPPPTNFA